MYFSVSKIKLIKELISSGKLIEAHEVLDSLLVRKKTVSKNSLIVLRNTLKNLAKDGVIIANNSDFNRIGFETRWLQYAFRQLVDDGEVTIVHKRKNINSDPYRIIYINKLKDD